MDATKGGMMIAYVIIVYGLIVAVAWSVPEALRVWGVIALGATTTLGALAMGLMRK